MAKAKSATVKVPVKTFFAPELGSGSDSRPTGGKLLFAHTIAWLEVFGMFKGKGRAMRTPGTVAAAIGSTALSYHSHEKRGNFGRDAATGKVTLTDRGLQTFAARVGRLGVDQSTAQVVDNKIVKAMIAAIKKGGTVEGIKFARKIEVRW
jgi:uncharacterized membrane protein YebE (DUF533 family)